MTQKLERRFIAAESAPVLLEQREEGESQHIVGLGAVTYDGTANTEYELWEGGPVERIMPGAFKRAIKEDDVRGLFNHNPDHLLGRTSAGTMKLKTDKAGLNYDITPPESPVGDQVRESIRRGDLSGSSFSFHVTDERWKKVDDREIREIRGVRLFDVGPVTFPAYEATTTGVRCEGDMTEVRASHASWKAGEALDDEIAAEEDAAEEEAAADAERQRQVDLDRAEARSRVVGMRGE